MQGAFVHTYVPRNALLPHVVESWYNDTVLSRNIRIHRDFDPGPGVDQVAEGAHRYEVRQEIRQGGRSLFRANYDALGPDKRVSSSAAKS